MYNTKKLYTLLNAVQFRLPVQPLKTRISVVYDKQKLFTRLWTLMNGEWRIPRT